MSEYEVRDMSGSAFKNRNKRNDKDASYTGTVKIKGEEFWINIWVRKDKNDNPWFSFSFREKKPSASSSEKQDDVAIDDNIPF